VMRMANVDAVGDSDVFAQSAHRRLEAVCHLFPNGFALRLLFLAPSYSLL